MADSDLSSDTETDTSYFEKQSNPYPRDCKECRPLLVENLQPTYNLRYHSRDDLVDKVKQQRIKIRNQSIRLRHVDHELYDLQSAKDKLAIEAKRAIEQEVRLSDRLKEFGLHPDQKTKESLQHNESEMASGEKLDATKEDLAAIRDIDFSLRIYRYESRISHEHQTDSSFYRRIHTVDLSAQDLASYYDLGQKVLQKVNALTLDMNVVFTVEVLPRMSARTYFRVLHPGQFAMWVEGMKTLGGGEYEIVAYLYTTKEAQNAVMKLTDQIDVLKF